MQLGHVEEAASPSMRDRAGILAHEAPVRQGVERLERLDPAWLHPMHGGSFTRRLAPRFYRALREKPSAYSGVLVGRQLPA
jgi:hypothetical protein